MKHYYLLLAAVFAALSAPFANADPISPQQAMAIARNFSDIRSFVPKIIGNNAKPAPMTVAYTATSSNGSADNLLYVINRDRDNGFVVVAGDDAVANPVLGYTDSGSFSYDKIPDNLKWWLGEYARQIEYMTTHDITSAPAPTFESNAGPLITTRWNQYEPYNNLCPIKQNERVVTGCVATAMAQVINYYEWPKQGTGSHSYEWNGQTLSADFGSTTYDWNNMADIYDGTNSDAENDAVATLMYHCGVSVDMNYDISANGGSGAFSMDVPVALVEYFGYASDVILKSRDYYSYNEWLSMLKAEIDARRPIYYSAQSTSGGHAFVLDGYNTDGYFHVNWGWGGLSDGYYQIATLNPYEGQGAGAGSDSGFAYDQDAIFNLHIPEDGVEYEPETLFYIDQLLFAVANENGEYFVNYGTTTVSKADMTGFVFQRCYNRSPQTFNGSVGVYVEDDDGEIVNVYTSEVAGGVPSNYGWSLSMIVGNITMGDYADGHYRAYPCYIAEGDESPTRIAARKIGSGYVDITVTGDEVTLATQANALSNIIKSDILVYSNDEFNNNEYATILVNLTNTGTEYYNSNVCLILMDGNGNIAYPVNDGSADFYYPSSFVSVAPGETKTLLFTQPITDFARDGETYYMTLYDTNLDSFEPVYTPINVNNPDIEIADYEVADDAPGNFTINMNFNNTSSTDYAGTVGALVFGPVSDEATSTRYIKMLDAEQMEIAAGGSGSVTLQGAMTDLAPGTYYINIYSNSHDFGYFLYEIKQPVPVIAGNVEITNEDPANLTLTASFKNPGVMSYTGAISAKIYEPDGNGGYAFVKTLDTQELSIPAEGQSQVVTFSGSFSEGTPGCTYQIRLCDDVSEAMLGSIEYTIEKPEVAIVGEINLVDENPASLTVTAIFENKAKWVPYKGMVSASIHDITSGEIVGTLYSHDDELIIPAGEQTEAITFDGVFVDYVYGGTYQIRLYDDVSQTLLASLDYTVEQPEIAVVGEMELTDGDPASLTVTAVFENRAVWIDYAGTVSASIHNASNGERIALLASRELAIPVGGQSEITTFAGTFAEGAPGSTYLICLYDDESGTMLASLDYTVEQPDVAISGVPQITDDDPDKLTVTAVFENKAEWVDFEGSISAEIFDDEHVKSLDSQSVVIAAGEQSGTITFSGSFPEGVPGKDYRIYFSINGGITLMLPYVEYTVPETVGINGASAVWGVYPNPVDQMLNIAAAAAIERIMVYGISGTRVAAYDGDGSTAMQIDMGGLTAGTYFVRIITATGIETVKVIKN